MSEVLEDIMKIAEEDALMDKILFEKLSLRVNYLITQDFDKLLYWLYRMDIPETKLRNILDAQSGSNAGDIIARMIVDRHIEKIISRKKYKMKPGADEDGLEKW